MLGIEFDLALRGRGIYYDDVVGVWLCYNQPNGDKTFALSEGGNCLSGWSGANGTGPWIDNAVSPSAAGSWRPSRHRRLQACRAICQAA